MHAAFRAPGYGRQGGADLAQGHPRPPLELGSCRRRGEFPSWVPTSCPVNAVWTRDGDMGWGVSGSHSGIKVISLEEAAFAMGSRR